LLYLTDQLNLNLQNGDRIEITVIETPSGGVRLGISAPDRKSLQKSLADVEVMPAVKHKQPEASRPEKPQGAHGLRRRAKP